MKSVYLIIGVLGTLINLVLDTREFEFFPNLCLGSSIEILVRVKDMAQDAYELLQHLGWTKDVLLAGVSMGAFEVCSLMKSYRQ